MKFLGVILDENVTWKEHIKLIENKTAKNIGILYKAKFLLNQNCLINIYYSFIHCYLNYANISWCSTNHTKLTKLFNKQKHASRINFNVDKFTHSRPLLVKLNVLNICQIKGPFKNDVTQKMPIFKTPYPLVTLCHKFHTTPPTPPLCDITFFEKIFL